MKKIKNKVIKQIKVRVELLKIHDEKNLRQVFIKHFQNVLIIWKKIMVTI